MARWSGALVALMLAVAMLALAPVGAAMAQGAGDTHGERVAAAQRLLKVQRMETMMMDIAEGMTSSLPPEQRQVFLEAFRQEYDIAALESAAMNALVKLFTAREIDAMATFYGSPEGQSIQRKMGSYMAEVQPVIQRTAVQAVQRYMQKQQGQPRPAPR